jgi:hypothetical protein
MNVPLHLPHTFTAYQRITNSKHLRVAMMGEHGLAWPWESLHIEALSCGRSVEIAASRANPECNGDLTFVADPKTNQSTGNEAVLIFFTNGYRFSVATDACSRSDS